MWLKRAKSVVIFLLISLLIGDLAYSFVQHLSMPLDGDMAGGIIPVNGVKAILSDPLGLKVISNDAFYPNPNRFFAHWTYYHYFNSCPIWLQNFTSPINSIYLSCALAKTSIQFLFIILLSFIITDSRKIWSIELLTAALLITPLFQTNGYSKYMGIIDQSITYTFFYALPCLLIILFYYPFFTDEVNKTKSLQKKNVQVLLLLLSFVVVFNGPLNPGLLLTINLLYCVRKFTCIPNTSISFFQRILFAVRSISKPQKFFLIFTSILSVYAIYIGMNNQVFQFNEEVSILERYSRLPLGVYYQLTQKPGLFILLLIIGINIFLLRKKRHEIEIKKTLRFFNWIGWFALLFILLLPLGGYKDYRPNILRYDTIMPITIGLIYIFGKSTSLLMNVYKNKTKYTYLCLILIVSFIFTNADKSNFNANNEEKLALMKISKSKDKIVFIENDCTVLSWNKITNYQHSESNGYLLKKWNITDKVKYYYQKE